MKKIRSIELTLTSNYIKNWTFSDAIRELIQNGIDQETKNKNNEFVLSYDEEEETIRFFNPESTLEINTLLLGCSSKTDDNETIGKFGEGYKIAALVLNRLEKSFTVYNNNKNEIWISKLEESETFCGEKTLMFDIYNHKTDDCGLSIEVENVSTEEYDSLAEIWLEMPQNEYPEHIETEYGEILTSEDMHGKLYVNGIFVEQKKDKYYGYNFKPQYIELERDRKSCDNNSLDNSTASMIIEAVNSGKIEAKEVIKFCKENSGYTDIIDLAYTYNEDAKEAKQKLIDAFDEENENSIPVSSNCEYERVKNLGGNPVVVPYYLYSSISSYSRDRIDSLIDDQFENEMTVKEKLKQWRDLYKNNIPSAALNKFDAILNIMED